MGMVCNPSWFLRRVADWFGCVCSTGTVDSDSATEYEAFEQVLGKDSSWLLSFGGSF